MDSFLKTLLLLTPVYVSFFWSIVLFTRNRTVKQPGFYMALLMFDIFLMFVSISPAYFDNTAAYIKLDPLFLFSAVLIFPLIYFYVRFIINHHTITVKDVPHIMPALILFLVATVLHLLLSEQEQMVAYKTSIPKNSPIQLLVLHYLNLFTKYWVLAQIAFYFVLCINLILQLKRKITNYFKNLEPEFFNWTALFYFVFVGASLAGAWLLFVGDTKISTGNENMLVPAYLFLSIVFFIVSYIANHKRDLEKEEFYEKISTNHLSDLKLKRSDISTPEVLAEQLNSYFEKEKPYLNPKLKITDVSRKLNSNRTYISALIKDNYQTNFSRFVNSWRVKQAEELLKSQKHFNYTTRSIAEQSGFNNYNTFVKAFREEFHTTPASYRKKYEDN